MTYVDGKYDYLTDYKDFIKNIDNGDVDAYPEYNDFYFYAEDIEHTGIIDMSKISAVCDNGNAEIVQDASSEIVSENQEIEYSFRVKKNGKVVAFVNVRHGWYDAYYRFHDVLRIGIYACEEKGSFPLTIKYDGVEIFNANINVDITDYRYIYTREKVREIENEVWTDTMTDDEKMKAIDDYITENYHYAESDEIDYKVFTCLGGAMYVYYAALDLGCTNIRYYKYSSGGSSLGSLVSVEYNDRYPDNLKHTRTMWTYSNGTKGGVDAQGHHYSTNYVDTCEYCKEYYSNSN